MENKQHTEWKKETTSSQFALPEMPYTLWHRLRFNETTEVVDWVHTLHNARAAINKIAHRSVAEGAGLEVMGVWTQYNGHMTTDGYIYMISTVFELPLEVGA